MPKNRTGIERAVGAYEDRRECSECGKFFGVTSNGSDDCPFCDSKHTRVVATAEQQSKGSRDGVPDVR